MKASVPKVRWGEWAKEFADEIHTDLFGDLLQLLHLEDSATTSALPTTGVGGQQSGSFESNPEQISCLWQRLAPGRPHQEWSHEYSGNCEHFWGILRGREGGCGGPTRHGVSCRDIISKKRRIKSAARIGCFIISAISTIFSAL